MCTTTHQPLLNLLRRVCVQLADLAANTSIVIARGILDNVYEALVSKEDQKQDPKLDSKQDLKYDSKHDSKHDCKHDLKFDSKFDTKYDLKFESKYDSKFDSKYDSKFDTKYDSKYDLKYDSKFDSRYDSKFDSKTDPTLICNAQTSRLLNFLACLVTHGTIKCSILQLLNNSSSTIKGDDKYPRIISAFVRILKTHNDSNYHVQSQECILSLMQSLCDCEISLYQNPVNGQHLSSEVYLANALPTKEILIQFLSVILDHLMCYDNSFVTYLPAVRTLILLTEHDYGFYHLKECASRKSEPFFNIVKKLAEGFNKDNTEYLSTLNTLIEFLRLCTAVDEMDESVTYRPRCAKMSPEELKNLIGWKDSEHPLCRIEEILKVRLQ